MTAWLPTGIGLVGAGLALWSGWRCRQTSLPETPTARRLAPFLAGWAMGFALVMGALGLDFGLQGMPDHAATAYAAALALLLGHLSGLALLALSSGRPLALTVGLWMTLGLPPFGAFAGLWLGLQALQASLLLLPAWPSLLHAATGLACLGGWVWAWQGGERLRHAEAAPQPTRRAVAIASGFLVGLGVLAGFLPWLWVLPAQVGAGAATGELPMLLVALGMMLTPVIPGQASVIPFGILAIAMALTSVLLLVLRLTRRPR